MDRTSRSALAAAIAAILVLTACAGGPGAEPEGLASPPPPVEPATSPVEPAAPLPEPAAPPREPAMSPEGSAEPPPGSLAEYGARLQAAIDRRGLSDAEQDCLIESGESPEVVASRTGVDETTARVAFASGMARCLPDVFLMAEFDIAAEDVEDLSQAELSCARQWLAGRGGQAFGAAYVGDREAKRDHTFGLWGCVPSEAFYGLFDPDGEDWTHLTAAELLCARDWMVGADRDLLRAVGAGDTAAAAEYRLGLARCFPGVFVAAWFDVDAQDFNAEELSCVREWLWGVDTDTLATAATGKGGTAFALGLALIVCHPGAFVPAVYGVEAGGVSEDEALCLQGLLSEVDEETLAALHADDDTAVAAVALGIVKCVPDLFLGDLLGLDVGEMTGNEMSCVRELVVRIDVDALDALITGEGPVATVFGLGLAKCLPDLFLGDLLADLGLDVGDLTGHEMSCLREWVARIDFSTLEAAAGGDEAAAATLDLGLIACVGDRIPLYDDGIRTRWGIA